MKLDLARINRLIEAAFEEGAVEDFVAKGGVIQQIPYKKPSRKNRTFPGSNHIGGLGDAKSGKGGRSIGRGANTNFKGDSVKPVVSK